MARISGDERKRLIVRTALPLFARQGFEATTTKQLAGAAGVSEALLYKHFPSKESLYKELEGACFSSLEPALAMIEHLPNSTETIVFLIYAMLRQITQSVPGDGIERTDLHRLMFQSYLSDGELASLAQLRTMPPVIAKIKKCAPIAIQQGDMLELSEGLEDRIWFCHHTTAFIALTEVTAKTTVSYKAATSETLQAALSFCLRGLGLTQSAIAKYAQSHILDEMFLRILAAEGQ